MPGAERDRPDLFFERFYQEGGWEHDGDFHRQLYWARKERYAEVIGGLAKGLRVLDVGCGEGELRRLLSEDLYVYGLDVSIAALKEARQFYDTALCGLAEGLPFADDTFDMALFIESINYVLDPSECLKEMRRVIRPRGWLLVNTQLMNPPWDHWRFGVYKALNGHTLISTYSGDRWPEVIYRRSAVKQLLKNVGFVIEREVPTVVTVPMLTRSVRCLPLLQKLGKLYPMFSINTLFVCRVPEDK
jgi:ubiquinone/menaquinone biosynthesis C-methylase UbiE